MMMFEIRIAMIWEGGGLTIIKAAADEIEK